MEHLDDMDDLRGSVGLNAYAQRNPITEYQIIGGEMFDQMVSAIREDTVRMILSATPRVEVKREAVAKITGTNEGGGTSASAGKPATARPAGVTVRRQEKVGRNDPCPCGSGKKYKKCCGANKADDE
jgi:preprotein translocase subunit SecA